MVEQFQNLLSFFGISGAPETFGELVPWLVTVLCCVALVMGIIKLMFGLARSLDRWNR